jgi:uncharacterized protein
MISINLPSNSSLTSKMVQFGRLLKQQGLDVTHTRIADTLRSCKHIRLWHQEEFYDALRANLVSQKEHLKIFDTLFYLFWVVDVEDNAESEQGAAEEINLARELSEFVLPFGEEMQEETAEKLKVPAASLYETLVVRDFSKLSASELDQMRQLIARAVRRVCMRLGHRYRASLAAQRLDFRRSFRSSLKVGGELIDLKFRRRKPHKAKIILILDISGSMDIYSRFFLQFMLCLQQGLKNVESFVFSTRLTRITPFLQSRMIEQSLTDIGRLQANWSGGTNIGASLEQFCTQYLDEMMPQRKLIVLIASDGWDRGNPERLRSAMVHLRNRAYKILWLNPLLASPQYQPLCLGIRTALPYVDHFLPFYNLKNLLELTRLLERIAANAEFVAA